MSVVSLHSIATAYPPHVLDQDAVMAKAVHVFGHKPELMQRMATTFGNAGVKRRHSCVPLEWYGEEHGWPERMALFEQHALTLLTDAGARALTNADVAAQDVAATVTVSSTGIATPSLDSLLQAPLGLRPTTQRCPIFGLGCAGGVIGLARAASLAKVMPGQWVLFLCTELCGLTFRRSDDSKANIIGTTIFGDGAAAVLVRASDRPEGFGTIDAWGEHTWPASRDVMGWRVEDNGLGVVFSRHIPSLVRAEMRAVSEAFLAGAQLSAASVVGYIVHPGGEKVITALEEVYDLPAGYLADARQVLAERGNMSAVTVLAVLEETLKRKPRGRHLMSALGPGFSAAFNVITLQ
jgi:alkylresorcinol/alkylpyrone synthase